MFKKILFSLLLVSTSLLAKPELTVYTYDSFAAEWGPGPQIKQAFEKQCECTLNLVALEDGVSLLNRLRLEGKKSRADIVLGLDNNLMAAAEKTGLFTAHQIQPPALVLPFSWVNTSFLPYDYGYFSFIYDNRKIPHPPASMEELINSQQPWKIIIQDPRTSTPGLGLLLWMQNLYGEKTDQAWKKLSPKILTVTKGWSEAYGLFLRGEADFVLSYTTSPAYHIIEEQKTQYASATFSEGHYIQVEVAGMLASSQQPELARTFLRFMFTPDFQQAMALKNWMYPVTDIPLPEGYQQLPKPDKTLQFSSEEVATQRTNWIRTWQNAIR